MTWTIGSSQLGGVDIGASQQSSQYSSLAETAIKEQMVWFSEVGDYDDFDEGVNDADAFSLSIPTTNDIKWVEALDVLFLGTTGDEWIIRSNDLDTPITPNNWTVKQYSNHGSKAIQPIKINEQILFVDFVGRKVRELTFTDAPGKVVPDLTALAEHITASGIVCIAHQRNPDSILWAVLDDGSLLSMTYEREQDVVAWSKYPIDGTVQSACIIPSSDEDEIWLSIRRTINGSDVTYIEKMMPRDFGSDLDDAFFVDCGLTYDSTATSTVTAAHLKGETVSILADGVVFDDAVADASTGVVTLKLNGVATQASTVQYGLAYTYKLEPMRPDITGPGGTTHGSIVKVPEMGISFLKTMNAKYGVDDNSLYDIDWANSLWTNNAEIDGLFTGDVVVSINGGFTIENNLIISGSDPLPCTVRALVPRIDKTGR